MRQRFWEDLLSLQASFLGAWREAYTAVFADGYVPLTAVPLRAAPLRSCSSHNGSPWLPWRSVAASSPLERKVLRKHGHGGVGGRRRRRWKARIWRRVFPIVGCRPVAAGPGAKFNAPPGILEVLQVTRVPVQALHMGLLLVHWAVRGQRV